MIYESQLIAPGTSSFHSRWEHTTMILADEMTLAGMVVGPDSKYLYAIEVEPGKRVHTVSIEDQKIVSTFAKPEDGEFEFNERRNSRTALSAISSSRATQTMTASSFSTPQTTRRR